VVRRVAAGGAAAAAVALTAAGFGTPAAPARAGAQARPHAAHAHPAAACRPRIVRLARGQAGPDDLAYDGSQLLVSDVKTNTLGVVRGGRVQTLMSGFSEPEGIVPRSAIRLGLAEHKTNRVLAIDLAHHSRRTIATLPTVPGQSGVDSIQAAPGGDTYLPDSANGNLYLLHHGRVRLMATGMVRPVHALYWHGAIRVADEYASVIWTISGHRRTRLARLTLPDDLAVVDGRLLAISQFARLWEVAPRVRLISKAFKYLQGLAPAGPDAVVVTDQTRNTIDRITGLRPCL